MWDIVLILAGVIAFLVLLELFALPDWIGRKLRGDISNKELTSKIESLESRIAELEKKTDSS